MGVSTIFNPDHTVNGAVFLIQLFLMLKSETDDPFGDVLSLVLDQVYIRISECPPNPVMKRLLYGIVMAAMMSNFIGTVSHLSSKDVLTSTLNQILNYSVKKIENPVERKLHTVVFTNILTQSDLPSEILDLTPKLIERITDLLVRTKKTEAKKASKKDKKALDIDSDSFDDEFNSDDSEGEGSENEDYEIDNGNDDEEDKGGEGESTDGNEGDEVIETEVDAQTAFSMMKSGFNEFDEFNYFKYVMTNLYSNHAQQMEGLIAMLPEATNKSLKDLMQTNIIQSNNGSIHRKIVKVRRAKN